MLNDIMNYTDKGKNISATYETTVIINCVLNVPLVLISVIGNALVLAAILKYPSIRSPSTIMLCSLAVSDLVGILAQPLFIADELQSSKSQDILLHRVTAMAGFFVCGVSLGTMTLISVDRFMALHYHLGYSTLVSKSRAMYAVLLIWLSIFLWLGFYLWHKLLYHLMAGIFTALCLIICTFSYIRIYLIVRQQQPQIQVQQQAVENSNTGNNTYMLRLKKSAINTFVFYVCMVVCYFPNAVIMTMFGTLRTIWKTEWKFATTVVFMNSSINPVLYCWRLRELRTAIVRTSKRLLFKQTGEIL